jgi:hypothetical protein
MRPNFVSFLLVVTAMVLVGVFYLKNHLSPVPVVPPPASPEVAAVPFSEVSAKVVANPVPPPVTVPIVTLTPEQRQAAMDAEIQRLFQAGMSDNPDDLTVILADLSSPEKEIREAAIQAAKQFGSTNAIPTLQAAAATATNPREQAELLEAADFIALPSVGSLPPPTPKTPEEIQAKKQQIAQWQADRQAKLQQHLRSPGQNSQANPAPDQNAAPPQ